MVNVIKLDGREYVILPKADYLKLAGKDLEGAVDAAEYARKTIGHDLRAAREAAGISQAELAGKLGKTQPMVSGAESGSIHVGERYVASVLKACGLPKAWKAPRAKKATPSSRRSSA